jgi:hypothetical protein
MQPVMTIEGRRRRKLSAIFVGVDRWRRGVGRRRSAAEELSEIHHELVNLRRIGLRNSTC